MAVADTMVTSSSSPAVPSGTWSTKRGWPASHASPATTRVSKVSVVVNENAERAARAGPIGWHLALAARAGGGQRVHRARRQGQPGDLAGRQRRRLGARATGATVGVRRDVEAAGPAQLDDRQERSILRQSGIARQLGRYRETTH